MLEQLTSSEFEEWLVFYNVEPFGNGVADLRHGQHLAMMANINRDTKSRPEPYSAADFMISPSEQAEIETQPETVEQISARIGTELFGV